MEIGVVFPQTELGGDVGAVRAYAAAVEGLGFEHLLAYDHVVGADPAVYEGWNGPYDIDTTFHEPLVLFGFLAGITQLELVSGVLILPQRQTALVAKQAAEVDLLSEGRLRLGVGIGWNQVEYDALGRPFGDRGRRSEEQVALLRRLWTERSVSHEGRSERVVGAGLAPLPVQRPIPVWIGGRSDAAYRRMGRIADGWFPMVAPGDRLDEAQAIIDVAAVEAGRDPATIGMHGQARYAVDGVDGVVEHVAAWRASGATHVSVDTMRAGLVGVDAHIAALQASASALGRRGG